MEPYQFTYFVPSEYLCYTGPFPPPDTRKNESESRELADLNKKLEKEYEELQKEKAKLEEENRTLKRQLRPKRRYSKRRMNLLKDYRCPHSDCNREYSSSIALNSHLKKKHNEPAEDRK